MRIIVRAINHIRTYFRVLFESISRTLAYIPVIWRMRDFDHAFNLELFAFSLRRLYSSIEQGYEAPDSKRVKLKKLLTMIAILERMARNQYEDNQFEAFERKWGEAEYDWEKSFLKDLRKDKLDETSKKRYVKELRDIMPLAEKQYKHELELLFKLWRSNYRSFWS